MFAGFFTHSAIRLLDRVAGKILPPRDAPAHQVTGRRGEEDAYFYLRKRGYVMVARNFRSSRRRGEIDLIGWQKDVLCFIEVKTRTTHDVKPAQAAVDREKQRQLAAVARDYLRHLPPSCQWRFDVLTVYYDRRFPQPQFQLFQNAFQIS
jgi:putative endonuclease